MTLKMINKNIDLEKKNQRQFFSKKRLLIHQSLNLKNVFFYKLLNNYQWYEKSKIIASFISIKSEIPTNNINNFIRESGKILCLPVIENNSDNKLIFKSFVKGDSLAVGKFGVQIPINTKSYLPDIIFTPCLAFDKHGYRLGYGGGYYDKTISYLYSIGHSFLSIGLAYDEQMIDKVLHNHLDQKLNYILTEKQLYKI